MLVPIQLKQILWLFRLQNIVVIGLVSVGGCMPNVQLPAITLDHPANPDAVASPIPPASKTLSLSYTLDISMDEDDEHSNDTASMHDDHE